MGKMGIKAMLVVIAVSGLFQTVAWGGGGPQQGRFDRRGPPPEAVEACKNISEGDSVEVSTPRGDTIKATCKKINGELAALPDSLPPGMGDPPQENGDAQQTWR
jgi:hypothetical protein